MMPRPLLLAALAAMAFAADARAQGSGATPPVSTATATPPATGNTTTAPRRQPTAAQAAQQERMRNCNAQATERSLRGDARRSFMSTCLSARGAPDQPVVTSPRN